MKRKQTRRIQFCTTFDRDLLAFIKRQSAAQGMDTVTYIETRLLNHLHLFGVEVTPTMRGTAQEYLWSIKQGK